MSPDKIKKFNKELEKLNIYEQGIFTEPNNIPIHIKEPVLYQRYEIGGVIGGITK